MNSTRWPMDARFGPTRQLFAAWLIVLGALCIPTSGHGQEIQVDAPRFRYDAAANTYTYENARVTLGELVLDAESLVINTELRTLVATGAVRFREGSIFGTGERLELDLDANTGVITEAHIYDAETKYYLSGKIIGRTGPGTFTLQQCSITTCTPRENGWRLTASTLNYVSGEYVTATNAVLEIGPLPIFWFPFVAWPAVEERRSGFLAVELTFQDSSLNRLRSGTRVSAPYFLALGDDHDLTFYPEFISERGPALGTEYRYAFVGDQRGQLQVWGVTETYFRDPEAENDILPEGEAERRNRYPRRYTLDYGHTQSFAEQTRLTIFAQSSSDGQVRREYDSTKNYRPYRVFQSTVSHQALWGNSGITLERRVEFTDESLYADAEGFTDFAIRPTLAPRVIYNTGYQLFERLPLALDVDAFTTRFSTKEGIGGRVTGARPVLSLPVSLFGFAELIPTVERQFVQYDSLVCGDPDFDDSLVGGDPDIDDLPVCGDLAISNPIRPSESYFQDRTELEIRFPFSRIYPGESPSGIDLKHVITPRLIKTDVADVVQPFAGHVVEPNFTQQLLTFRLDNQWLTRIRAESGGESITQVGTLNLIQRYNLLLEDEEIETIGPALPTPFETEPGEPLLPAILEGSINAAGLKLNLLFSYHHQLAQINQTNISVSGTAGPRSKMSIAYSQNDFKFRTPDNKLVPAKTSLKFGSEITTTDQTSLGFTGVINLDNKSVPLNRRIENGLVFFDYRPGCCSVRISYEEFIDSFVEDEEVKYLVERRFLITFNLGGLFAISSKTRASTGETTVSPGL